MSSKEYYEDLLINNEVEKAFKNILIYTRSLADDSSYSNFLILSSRWNRNKERHLRGVLSFDQYNIEENQIINAFYQYLRILFR